jgi:hypothetical protein
LNFSPPFLALHGAPASLVIIALFRVFGDTYYALGQATFNMAVDRALSCLSGEGSKPLRHYTTGICLLHKQDGLGQRIRFTY